VETSPCHFSRLPSVYISQDVTRALEDVVAVIGEDKLVLGIRWRVNRQPQRPNSTPETLRFIYLATENGMIAFQLPLG